MPASPLIATETTPEGVSFTLSGDWTIDAGAALERSAATLAKAGLGKRKARIDISGVDGLDTAGAWVIDRARQGLNAAGVEAEVVGVSHDRATLLDEAKYRRFEGGARAASVGS